MKKRLTVFLLCIVFAFSACVFAACSEKTDNVVEKDVPIFGIDGFTESKSLKLAASDTSDTSQGSFNIYTLTATIRPSDTENKLVDWSIDFVPADATETSWATGKTVTDYVTLNVASDGALTATVTCKAAFAATIKITVTSRSNPGATASCNAYYRQRPKLSQTLTFTNKFFVEGNVLSSDSVSTVKPIINQDWQYMANIYARPHDVTPSKDLGTVYTKSVSEDSITSKILVFATTEFYNDLKAAGIARSENDAVVLSGNSFGIEDIYNGLCTLDLVPPNGTNSDMYDNLAKFRNAAKAHDREYDFTIAVYYYLDNDWLSGAAFKCKIDRSLCTVSATNVALNNSSIDF